MKKVGPWCICGNVRSERIQGYVVGNRVVARSRHYREVGMARTFESKITSDSGTDTDEEIWKTIRYLDPDGGLRKGDIVLGVIWTLVFVLLGLFIFLIHR